MNRYEREQYEYEQQRRQNHGRYDDSFHDHFGQSHYTPRYPNRDEQFRAGLTPGYYNNPNDEPAQQRYGRGYESGAQQGAYENWTPQYQNLSNLDQPYDQRRADPYQSASYNPRRAEYDPDLAHAPQQRGYAQYREPSQSYDPNRYSNPYGNPYPHHSPYRGQMAGENLPQGMTQREFGYSWYGNTPYAQANEPNAYGQPSTRYARSSQFGSQPYAGRGPKGYKRSDDRIKEEVCDALMHAGNLDPSEIEVSVSDGEVTLKGNVCCRTEKRHAEDIAENILGVKDVHTQIRIDKDRGQARADSSSGSSYASSSSYKSEDKGSAKSSVHNESKYSTAGSNR